MGDQTIGFADHQGCAVDDRGAVDFFLHQHEMQFVDDRQARQNKLASAPPAQPL